MLLLLLFFIFHMLINSTQPNYTAVQIFLYLSDQRELGLLNIVMLFAGQIPKWRKQ